MAERVRLRNGISDGLLGEVFEMMAAVFLVNSTNSLSSVGSHTVTEEVGSVLLIGECVALGSIVTTAGDADLSSSVFKMSTLKRAIEILLESMGGDFS